MVVATPPSSVVLVTGGTGLVGQALQHVISVNPPPVNEKWVFIGTADADLMSLESTMCMFEKYRPSKVVHLAAMVGGLFKNMRCQADMLRDNLLINDHVLRCCLVFEVEKAISCLSTCIFPDRISYPFDESMIHNGPPHPSNYGYAHAKRILDIQSRAYCDQYKCQYHCIIPTNVFGPHDNFNLHDGHVIPALIHKGYLAKQCMSRFIWIFVADKPLVVSGSGKPKRQFIYSRDLARLIVHCLKEYNDVLPIILSVDAKDEISIGEVAEKVAANLGIKHPLRFDVSSADGQFQKTASNAKLRSIWPNFKFTPIDQALNETVQWFQANYDKCRK